jgi:hypothetical protein
VLVYVSSPVLVLLVSQGLGFDCNQMVGKLVVCIFRDISLARKIEELQVL